MRGPLAALLFLSGCSFFGGGGASSSSSGGQTAYGFGAPALEITIDGVHFGPSAPDTTSTVDVITTRDATTDQVESASFSLHASSAETGASCDFDLERFGASTTPIATGTLQLAVATGTATADRTISPVGSPSVRVPQGSWSCGDCAGGLFVLSTLDQNHVEGYLSGTFDNSGTLSSVLCSFYLPIRTYLP